MRKTIGMAVCDMYVIFDYSFPSLINTNISNSVMNIAVSYGYDLVHYLTLIFMWLKQDYVLDEPKTAII